VFIFIVGAILFATLALLPPLLQDLLNYPVVTAGLVTSPRGVVPWLRCSSSTHHAAKLTSALIIAAAFALTALASWQMNRFDLAMDSAMVVWSGLSQG